MNNNTAQEKKVKDLFRWYDGITKYMVRELKDVIDNSENKEEIAAAISQNVMGNAAKITTIPGVIEAIKATLAEIPLPDNDDKHEEPADEQHEQEAKDEFLNQYLTALDFEDFLVEAIPSVLKIYKEIKSILYTAADIYPQFISFEDIDEEDDNDNDNDIDNNEQDE